MKNQIFTIIAAFFIVASAYCPAIAAPEMHKVKQGDSLCSIAKKYNVNVYKLKNQNNLKTNKLSVGQQIVIGTGSNSAETQTKSKAKTKSAANAKKEIRKEAKRAQPVEVAVTETENDGEFIEYRTKKGDTVDKIASRFSIDKEEILEANNLSDKKFKAGKIILIPRIIEENDDDFVALSTKTNKTWKGNDEKYMLVKVAKSFMGAPYKYGGESVRGLDCSAYVKKIYDIFDVFLPRSAREQFHAGEIIAKDELAIGDLVFFRTKRYIKYPTHVGIYIGDGNFIHSSSGRSKIGVKIDSLSSNFYGRTFIGAVRVKNTPEGSDDTTNASEKTFDNS